MRIWLCAMLLLMTTHDTQATQSSVPASIDDLAWMVGSWVGSLGPQTVEEAWTPARSGTMATMSRLSSEGGVDIIELIVIREQDDTLMLHLRQFSPALELRLSQDMQLNALSPQSASFAAAEDAAIKQLAYSREGDRLQVDVTIIDDTVFTAELNPS